MSVSLALVTRLERLGDRFNPIVVKEVRQSLKSRQFVGTFLLLLLAAWAGSIFGVSYLGESIDYGSSAVTFYAGFLFALCAATLVIVPFSTFRSIVEERTETTLELLQITALSPVQIVRGKTYSAMVQVLVHDCAIAPSSRLRRCCRASTWSTWPFRWSCCSSPRSFSASRPGNRRLCSQLDVSVFLGGFRDRDGLRGNDVLFQLDDGGRRRHPLRRAGYVAALALVVYLGLSTGFLCEQGAVTQLTFESDNRSTRIRLASRSVAAHLDRIADISRRARASADEFRCVGHHHDGDRGVHHDYRASIRQRPRFALTARQPRPAPLVRSEGALGPVSAGGVRLALCPHVALRAGLLCDGPAPRVYALQRLQRSANRSIRDRPGCLDSADLSRRGALWRDCCGASCQSSNSFHVILDSGTG